MNPQNIAPKTTGRVPTELLDFDPANPRLIEDGIKNPTDAQIILSLSDTADLAEVVESIAANGYIDIEPIIAQKTGNRWQSLRGTAASPRSASSRTRPLRKGRRLIRPRSARNTARA
jgi:hypothetical protein